MSVAADQGVLPHAQVQAGSLVRVRARRRALHKYLVQWNLLMAASALMLLPILVLFFAAQRYFVQGIVMSGLKG